MNENLKEQELFYNKYWSKLKPFGSYKAIRIGKIMDYLNIIRKEIRHPQILDLGCGDGRTVAIWNSFGKATGFELSAEAVETATNQFPGISFLSGNALNTELESNSFDVIISQEVIEHIEQQELYINECHRLLKKNGFLILTTPNKYYFDRVKGGNYSKQPIENILVSQHLRALLEKQFDILQLESVIPANANFGIYRLLFNIPFSRLISFIGLSFVKTEIIKKKLLGVHLCVLARVKNKT